MYLQTDVNLKNKIVKKQNKSVFTKFTNLDCDKQIFSGLQNKFLFEFLKKFDIISK